MKKKSCGMVLFHLIDEEPRYLIVQHLAGHWGIPKGGQEPGETDIETARREIREEVGIEDFTLDDAYRFVQQYAFERDGIAIEKEVVFFLAMVTSNRVSPQEEEIAAYQWVPHAVVRDYISHPETLALVDDVQQYVNKR